MLKRGFHVRYPQLRPHLHPFPQLRPHLYPRPFADTTLMGRSPISASLQLQSSEKSNANALEFRPKSKAHEDLGPTADLRPDADLRPWSTGADGNQLLFSTCNPTCLDNLSLSLSLSFYSLPTLSLIRVSPLFLILCFLGSLSLFLLQKQL